MIMVKLPISKTIRSYTTLSLIGSVMSNNGSSEILTLFTSIVSTKTNTWVERTKMARSKEWVPSSITLMIKSLLLSARMASQTAGLKLTLTQSTIKLSTSISTKMAP